ncbi:MAG: FtsX-like permease family protein [Candidatus Eisenbacteria bacterium]|nr:FtsX-like permease family protein [Candidatus Eisenbacteria bacterium]
MAHSPCRETRARQGDESMKQPLVLKIALRGLGRHPRRTALSVLGIGIGVAVALFLNAFMLGESEMVIRGVVRTGIGHLHVAPKSWAETRDRDLRLAEWRNVLEKARSLDEVVAAAPRASTTALLGFGTKVAGVEMLGVDPAVEPSVNQLVEGLSRGRYIERSDSTGAVIGAGVAERLDVGVDDALFATVVDSSGEIRYAMLTVVGIISTGSAELDASLCHVPIASIERMTGRMGPSGIAVLLKDETLTRRVGTRLDGETAPGDTVLTWQEMAPTMSVGAQADRAFAGLISVIVVFVVVLGITSAQLTSVLERKREFAVLMALGMRDALVVRLVLVEAVILGLLGGVAGLAIGAPFLHWAATKGLDFTEFVEGEFSMEGMLFDPVIYAQVGMWVVPYAVVVALAATVLAALYPARTAVTINPTTALSLREA